MITAEPGREFAFVRRERGAGELIWRYRFEPEGIGSRVYESYEVTKPIPRAMTYVMRWAFGCKDRPAELHAGMEATLERLAAVVERDVTSPDGRR